MKSLAQPRLIVLLVISSALLFVVESPATDSAPTRASQLKAELAGADKIIIEANLGWNDNARPFEFTGEAELAKLISALDFDDGQSGFYCACLGDHSIQFEKAGKPLAVISHHHGKSLRWSKGPWEGDSLFTSASATSWRAWFASHGYDEFKTLHDQALEETRQRDLEMTAFLSHFPGKVRLLLHEREDNSVTFSSQAEQAHALQLARKIETAFPDRVEMGLAICRALGGLNETGNGSWSSTTFRERMVLAAAGLMDKEDAARLFECCGDTLALQGAARLFFFEKLAERVPVDQRDIIATRLARVTFQNDKCGNSNIALRRLSLIKSSAVTELLMQVAAGQLQINPQGARDGEEPSVRAGSWMLLAQRQDPGVAAVLNAVAPDSLPPSDKAAYDIAQSFLGVRDRIAKDMFKFESYTIGLTALQALESTGGRNAIDLVIMAGTEHPWAAVREEAVLTAERMTKRHWYKNGPNERAEWHGQDVREWWAAHRSEFAE